VVRGELDEHVTFRPSLATGGAVGEDLGIEVAWDGLRSGESVKLHLALYASSYTGRGPRRLKAVNLSGGSSGRIDIAPEEYRAGLVDTGFYFEIRCFASVEPSEGDPTQYWSYIVRYALTPPELAVSGTLQATRGESVTATVRFTNPCPFPLGASSLKLTAPRGLTARVASGNAQQVGAGAEVTYTVMVTHEGGGRSAWPDNYPGTIGLELDTIAMTDVHGEFDVTFT